MLKIVLIDDEYFFRNSLKNMLSWEEYGFQITGDANNGKSGLELILDKQPDIAIVDINMPVLTGLELIEQVTEKKIRCKFILLTGYSEFKYAQKAIRLNVSEYILKPVDASLLLESLITLKHEITRENETATHIRTLEEHRDHQIKENFLLDLVNGHFSFNDSHLASYLEELNIMLSFQNYTIYLLHFSDLSSADLEKVRALSSEIMHADRIFELFIAGHSQICIIEESADESVPPITAGRLLRQLNAAGLYFHMGVSLLHHKVDQIVTAYDEADLCVKNAISRKVPVLYSNQINTSLFHVPKEQLDTLKRLLRLKESSKLQQILSELYTDFRIRGLSYDNLVFCTCELLSCLIGTLNENHSIHCFSGSGAEGLFDFLNTPRSSEELEQWITALFSEQLESGSSLSPDEDSSVSGKVEQYIRDHYYEAELNIDSISQELFLNYSYLCYCFKRDKNITINDYINQVRLEKALQLFHSGHDNVGYVAEQTGFNNSGYFSKKFKKAFGLSPSEYIKTL